MSAAEITDEMITEKAKALCTSSTLAGQLGWDTLSFAWQHELRLAAFARLLHPVEDPSPCCGEPKYVDAGTVWCGACRRAVPSAGLVEEPPSPDQQETLARSDLQEPQQ